MLPEISLNILDVAQNSISAKASLIQITVESQDNVLKVTICDDGCGMSEEAVAAVIDPFFTTRTTRKVGLGIPFFKQAAECTGGYLDIHSVLGEGTEVTTLFYTDHIDCMPLGDINSTIFSLVTMNQQTDFLYTRFINGNSFVLDTREMKEILGGVSFDTPEVSEFIRGYLEDNENDLKLNM